MTSRRCLTASLAAMIPLCAMAHPVFAPFDDTQFAPITNFGPTISLAPVATGLTAPNKGVAAPGDREHLYVVDQMGIAWKVNLAARTTDRIPRSQVAVGAARFSRAEHVR